MGSDLLGVSISGLRVSQNALRTTGHNIANANTEGYSRQTVDIASVGGTPNGAGYLGNGATTSRIERVVNEFVTAQTRQDTTLHSELNAYNDNILQLNDLISNASTGLTQGLQSFFSSVQNAADDPTSIASRQLLISESENLADRFNTLHSRLESINDGVNENIEASVSQVNTLVSQIAMLNRNIADATGAAGSNTPNDLLDQRDEMLRQLSQLVGVQVSSQDNNQINVTVGNGIPLVLGADSTGIQLGQNEFNPLQPEIYLAGGSITEPITDAFASGEMGGLLNFQETVIHPTYNEIGRLGILVADNMNELQQQGITLNNAFGSNIFVDINDANTASGRVLPSANNADNSPSVSLSITDTSQLTASNYVFAIDNSSNVYTVTRLSDNTEVNSSIMPVVFPTSITFDGLSLDITAGTFASGDQFLIQPTRQGGRDIGVQALNPEDIALGSPVLSQTSIGNLGNANISAGEVLGLVDASGTALPLFAQTGQMSPPLLIKFTTPTTYDVLDNSDPGNPVQLSPPLRNQTYVPGIENNLFPTDAGQTQVVSQGAALGLPVNARADLQAAAAAPSFVVSDFSSSTNQFAFDVVLSNTVGAINDGTFTVTVNSAAITDNATLLADINDDLAASRVRAYITDAGNLGFLSLDQGATDITLQNYNEDPDLDLNTAPAGQADALLGIAIESATFTTVADANGVSGMGVAANNYPAETLTFTTTDPTTNATQVSTLVTTANASARTTAGALDNINGVSANAFNYMELRDFSLSLTAPLQITLNGEDLVNYESAVLDSSVPAPAANSGEDFNDYLAERINSNANLSTAGIYAVSAYDASTSEFYIQVHSTLGDDFTVELEATAGEIIEVNDGSNADMKLIAAGVGTTTDTVIGGRLDITLDENVVLTTTPSTSTILGDSSAANFAQSSYLGIQAGITGIAQTGDTFTIDFNTNAAMDNRNALAMAGLQQQNTMNNGTQSFSDTYNQLIENVGIKTNTSQNNTTAAENVLEQTINLRNSVSGVNLDEEAANLIRFEQLYSANAQVISVARELFDRLINSF